MQIVACVAYLQRDAAVAPLQAHDSHHPNSAQKYIFKYDVKKHKKKPKKNLDSLQKLCVFFSQVGRVMFKAGGRLGSGGSAVASFLKRCLKGQRFFISKELRGWNCFCRGSRVLFQTEPLLFPTAVRVAGAATL